MKSQNLGLFLAIGGAIAVPAPFPEEQTAQQGQVAQVDQHAQAPQMVQDGKMPQMGQQGQMMQELSAEQRALITELSAQFPQLNALLIPGGSGGLLGSVPIIGDLLATLPLATIIQNLPILGPLLGPILAPLIGTGAPETRPGTSTGGGITIPGLPFPIPIPFPLPLPLGVATSQNQASEVAADPEVNSPISKREANAQQAAMAALEHLVMETKQQAQHIQQIINDHADAEPEERMQALVEPLTVLSENLKVGVSRASPALGSLLSGVPLVGDLLGQPKSPLGLVTELLNTVLNLVQSLLGGGGAAGGQPGLGQLLGGGLLNTVVGQSGLGGILGGLLAGQSSPIAPLINQILGVVSGLLPVPRPSATSVASSS